MELSIERKQTSLGSFPVDWEIDTLENLSTKITVGIASAATHAYRDKGIVLLRNQNIKNGFLDDGDILHISEEYEKLFSNKRLKKGDLITARTGYPGVTCIIPQKYEGAQSFTTLITRPKNEIVISDYLNFYINSESGQKFFETNQIGGGQKNVNAGTLKTMPIPFPPTKAEQTAIATALSDTDALITSLEKLIEKKRRIKMGVMQELLKPKEGWQMKKLGDIAIVLTGTTPPTNDIKNYGVEYCFVSPADLGNEKYITDTQKKLSKIGFDISRKFPKNSILFTCIGSTIGKSAIAGIELTSNQQINAVLPSEGFSSEYVYYYLNLISDQIKSSASEQAVPMINKTEFAKVLICLPSKNEQILIARVLSDIDEEIESQKINLGKYQRVKQGMMQTLLTGKIRLV